MLYIALAIHVQPHVDTALRKPRDPMCSNSSILLDSMNGNL